jgi:hypothetical protein
MLGYTGCADMGGARRSERWRSGENLQPETLYVSTRPSQCPAASVKVRNRCIIDVDALTNPDG